MMPLVTATEILATLKSKSATKPARKGRSPWARLRLVLCACVCLQLPVTRAAEAVALYENSGRTILRDAFARGTTVSSRATGLASSCYLQEWVDPSGVVVATHSLGTAGASRDDSFTLPLTAPNGVWTVRLQKDTVGSATDCSGFTVSATKAFDVARAVIIGAQETGGLGGDSFVDQSLPNTV